MVAECGVTAGVLGARATRRHRSRPDRRHRLSRHAGRATDYRPRITVEPPGTTGRATRGTGYDEPADRRAAVRVRADGREPRPTHPGQAGPPQPDPDRDLGRRPL